MAQRATATCTASPAGLTWPSWGLHVSAGCPPLLATPSRTGESAFHQPGVGAMCIACWSGVAFMGSACEGWLSIAPGHPITHW